MKSCTRAATSFRVASIGAALSALLVLGCQDPETTMPVDASADANAEAGAPRCVSSRVCVGNVVRKCEAGLPGGEIQTCTAAETCSAGRCISRACADAEHGDSVQGCLFYGTDIDNVTSDDDQTTTVLLANPGETMAIVDLELREALQPWNIADWTIIEANSAASFVLPDRHLEGGGLGAGKAFRIVSDVPISATLIESDDRFESSRSTGGTVLVPAHALRGSYMVMTYPQLPTPQINATPGSRRGAGQVVIVATDDDTTVTFRTSLSAFVGQEGGAPSTAPGQSFNLLLHDGDIYQIYSSADADDLSGSVITATKPIAVFSGNISTMYGRANEGVHSPDLAVEQMIPIPAWSLSYVAARLGPQEGTCDSIFGGNSALWRILAAQDNTQVSFATPPGVGGLPPALTLNAGRAFELVVSSAGSFIIKGDKPIMVTQAMDCEGTLSPGVATDPLLKDYLFALPANFDHEAVIVRREQTPVSLDGRLINESLFVPAGANFEVARVHIPPCVGSPDRCLHRLTGEFGLTLRGMDVVCGYALTPQPWVLCGGPDAVGCVN